MQAANGGKTAFSSGKSCFINVQRFITFILKTPDSHLPTNMYDPGARAEPAIGTE